MLITVYFETRLGTEVEAMINVDADDYWFDLVYIVIGGLEHDSMDISQRRQQIINRYINSRIDVVELVRQRRVDDREYYELSFID